MDTVLASYMAEDSGFGDADATGSVDLDSGSGGGGPMSEIGVMPSHSANSEAVEDFEFDFDIGEYINWEGVVW